MSVHNPYKLKRYTTTPISADRFLSLKKGTSGKVFDDALLFTDDYKPTVAPTSSYSFREYANPKYAPNIETVIEDTYRVFLLNPATTSILSVINITNTPITLMGRDGIKRTMPSLTLDGTSEGVIFRKVYCFNRKDVDLNKWFDSLKHNSTIKDNVETFKEAKLISKLYERSDAIITQLNKHVMIIVDFFVPSEDIHNLDLIYLNDIDLAFCFEENSKKLTHPHFTKEESNNLIHEVNTATLNYRIVDNTSAVSDKFFFAGDEVLRITPAIDITLTDGIYKTVIINGKSKTVYYALDECEDIGLYNTIEEARTLGNPSVQQEKELEELKHINKLLELEHRKEKIALESASLAAKAELDEAKFKMEQIKMEESLNRDRIKAEYEEVDRKRKAEHEDTLRQSKLDFENKERQTKTTHEEQIRRLLEEEKRKAAEYEEASYKRKDFYEHEHYERKNYHEKENSKQDTLVSILKITAIVVSTTLSIIAIGLKFLATKPG